MKKQHLTLTAALGLVVLAAAIPGCTANRVDLLDSGLLTLQKQATGKVYIAWSDAYKRDDGFLITGVLRRRDHVGQPIKAHVDVTILSPAGQVVNVARSSDIYVPRRVVGKYHPLKRFTVHFPSLPPAGSMAVVVAHTGSHDQSSIFHRFSRRTQCADGISERRNPGQNKPPSIFNGPALAAKLRLTAYITKRIANTLDIAHVIIDNNNHRLD
ncbi:MAG: hypothetical protein KAY65_16775 [Planctomycetes bacterium]|nr:hypothetical protein [Planctomycetota bacterium]